MFKNLISKFEKITCELKYPSFIFNEEIQVGTTFGEKLSNSIQEVYNKGFQKVIVIGNDCPALNTAILKNAITSLQTNYVVIGSNYNGGLYLIGIDKNHFNKLEFENLKWQTSNLYSNFKESFNTEIVELKTLNDLNNFKDIQDFIYNSFNSFFRNFIISLQQKSKLYINFCVLNIEINLIKIPLNKGSPVFL